MEKDHQENVVARFYRKIAATITKGRVPTLLGIAVLIAGLAAGVLLVQNRQFFGLRASPEISPRDIRITNITDSSFTVSWTTDKQTLGFVKWGEENVSINKATASDKDVAGFTHSVTISELSPNTSYFFKIASSGKEFDNNGIAWQTTTGTTLAPPSESNLIFGTILTPGNLPAENALVYVSIGGGSMLSATTGQDGSWIIALSNARSQDLTSYVNINEASTLAEISVQAGPLGVASAQVYPTAAHPSPPITLGQIHDFRNLPPSSEGTAPEASIEFPEEATRSSGFSIPEQITAPSPKMVTLESIEEGEAVTSTKPEFFGEGPTGTTLTITVESEPVTEEVTIDNSGNWGWSPPEGLSAGIHKITIKWRDASGILRTLSRSFIVQAAEEPAFEATPSATATPTPTPTPSPSPSPTPTPTASPSPTPTATPTPSPTPISTGAAIPEAGSTIPTIALFVLGIASIIFGGLLAVLSFSKKTEINSN